MPQSATPVTDSSPARLTENVSFTPSCHGLLELFLAVCDGRSDQGRDHPVAVVLALVAAATVAGLKGYTAMSGWVADVPTDILDGLYTRVDARPAGRPSRSTIWRVCTDTDTDVLDAVIADWTAAQRADLPGPAPAGTDTPTQVRLDGKTVRGAVDADGEQLHLLSALAGPPQPGAATVVIAQAPTDGAKTTEPATARALLQSLDLRDATVTADALHTVKATAELIHQRGGHFVLPVKENRCATRRSDTFPFQAGQTRREVCWVRWLTWIRKVKGTRACQETGGRVQMPETACRETRAVWRRLDCLNPNLQRQQFTATGKASETGVRRDRGVPVRPGQPSRRKRYPTRAFKEMSGAPAAALFRVSETNVGSPSQYGWRCRSARSSRRSNARPRRTGKPFTGRRGAGDADCEKRWRYA